jgi:4-hydroxy-tetrahydrodipicolinate synthase
MFHGTFVALVTPFRDGQLDRKALDALVDHVIAGGVRGLVPCGTTGESPTLTEDEQQQVIAAVVRRAAGRLPVIAGAGSNCTAKTLHLSQAAIRAGADAVMLVAPYYNRPNQQGLYEHFSYVARSISTPIMLYNIPSRTGVEISAQTICRLHSDYHNIAAVKHATGSIDGISELRQVSDIAIMCGDDTLTVSSMAVGASGVVSVVANLYPAQMSAITTAMHEGDNSQGQRLHDQLFLVARALMKLDTNPIPIKTALAIKGMIAEEFRLPLCRMDPARRAELEELLNLHSDSVERPNTRVALAAKSTF